MFNSKGCVLLLKLGSGKLFEELPKMFSEIYPYIMGVNHPVAQTFRNLKSWQAFVSLHLMTPGGKYPPDIVTSLRVIFLKVTSG